MCNKSRYSSSTRQAPRYLLLLFIFAACSPKNSGKAKNADSGSEGESFPVFSILLTESELGEMDLKKLSQSNLIEEINTHFPGFLISKTIGQQDGPNFDLYLVTQKEQEVISIAMKHDEDSVVDYLVFESNMIEDMYGVSVGSNIEHAIKNRPNLVFYTDLHFNVYASSEGSRIQYRLKGDLKLLNDSTLVAEDFSVAQWQVEKMEIEYLIWRE